MKYIKASKMYDKLMNCLVNLTISKLNHIYRKMSKAGWPINPGALINDFKLQLETELEDISWG